MQPHQLLFLIAVILAAVVLDLVLMAWLRRRYAARNNRARIPGHPFALTSVVRDGWCWLTALPAKIWAALTNWVIPSPHWLRDLLVGLALIAFGQQLIQAPGEWNMGLSRYLNEHLFLQIVNLDNVLLGLPILIAGCIVLARALRKTGADTPESNPGGLRKAALSLRHFQPLVGVTLLCLLGFVLLLSQISAKPYSAIMPAIWLILVGLFIWIVWRWDKIGGIPTSPNLTRQDLLWMLGLLLVGLLTTSFRLQAVPDQLIGDEGTFWSTARSIASGTYQPPLFDFGVYTYPILSSILQAAVIKLFGFTLWSWRFSSVLAGVAAIPPLYLLGREMFDRRVAVAACLAMIGLPYFLAFSRLGYNNIQTLFPVTLSLYFFYLGLKRGSAFYIFLGGCAAGLGYYTYTAGRSAMAIVALFMLGMLVVSPRRAWTILKAGVVFGIGWLVVAAPHLIYGMTHGGDNLQYKVFESLFINSGWGEQFYTEAQLFAVAPPFKAGAFELFYNPGIYLTLILRGFIRTVLAFLEPFLVNEHFIDAPLAGTVGAIFFVSGSALAAAGLRQRRYALLALWVVFTWFTLSALNTFPPRHQHMVGLIPALALLTGVGVVALVDGLGSRLGLGARWRNSLIGLVLAGICVGGFYNYFVTMPQRYRPGFEQIISWGALYAGNEQILYVYDDPKNSEFKPYAVREIRTDLVYQAVSAEDIRSGLFSWPQNTSYLVYYPVNDNSIVLRSAASETQMGSQRIFYNREGKPIGAAFSNQPHDFDPPSGFWGVLADSYLRPVIWPALLLALLLLAAWLWRRPVFAGRPGVVGRFTSWLFAPPVPLAQDPARPRREPVKAPYPASQPGALEAGPNLPASEGIAAMARPATTADSSSQEEPYRPFIEIEFKLRVNLPARGKKARQPAVVSRTAMLPDSQAEPLDGDGLAAARRPREGSQTLAGFLQSQFAPVDASLRELFAGRAWMVSLIAILAAAVTVAGQMGVFIKDQLKPGVNYLLAGGAALLIAGWVAARYHQRSIDQGDAPAQAGNETLIASADTRQALVIAALGIAGLNFILLTLRSNDSNFWDIFAFWLASIALIVLAFLPRSLPRLRLRPSRGWALKALPILGILLAAAFLRFYQLGNIPLVMENDEGTVGTQALHVLAGDIRNMFATYSSFGTLDFFITALPVDLLGRTRLALRLLTALGGLAAIPVVYLLAKSLFGRKVALASAALLAVSHMAIHFSRISPAASSFDPLISALAFLLVYRGLQTRKVFSWMLAGVVMALGLYFYIGARAITLAVIVYLIALLVFDRRALAGQWSGMLSMAGSYLVVAAPMLAWALRYPNIFNARMNQVGILQNGWLANEVARTGKSVITVLAGQLRESLLIFNFYPARWFYESPAPMLGLVTGALFAMGLVYALLRLRDRRFLLLNAWFWSTLVLGQVLATDPAPSAYRTLGLLPAACILAAIALVELADLVFLWLKAQRKWLAALLVIAVIAGEAAWNVNYYFAQWAPSFVYSDPNSRRASLIGDYLAELGGDTQAYMVGAPEFLGEKWNSLTFLRGNAGLTDVMVPLEEVLPKIKPAATLVFIFTPQREAELAAAQSAFPGGKVVTKDVNGQRYFMAYEVHNPPVANRSP